MLVQLYNIERNEQIKQGETKLKADPNESLSIFLLHLNCTLSLVFLHIFVSCAFCMVLKCIQSSRDVSYTDLNFRLTMCVESVVRVCMES